MPVPNWAQRILTDFRDYVEQDIKLGATSKRGLVRISAGLPVAERLWRLDLGEDRALTERDIASERLHAEFAAGEIASDFRLLHSHSIVGVWGALETMVFDMATAWLLNVPNARQVEAVTRIKVSLALFDAMDEEDRMRSIVHELERGQGQRSGIDRFEMLLDPLFLTSSYPSVLAENLFIVQQIRNVFAHRRGVADGRFVTACPFIDLAVGDPVPVTTTVWHTCIDTIICYGLLVESRVAAHFGEEEVPLLNLPHLRSMFAPREAPEPAAD
jgi:hypothetical protein